MPLFIFGRLYISKILIYFFQVVQFICLQQTLMILCISMALVVTSPLLLKILFICPLSSFLGQSTEGLLMPFILSRNQVLVLLIFLLLQSVFHLLLFLLFIISFLRLIWGFICSFICKVKIVYLKFFLFLDVGLYWYELPSQKCFCCTQYILVCHILYSFVSRYFSISSLISLITHCLFSNMLFNIHVFMVFPLGIHFLFCTIVFREDA